LATLKALVALNENLKNQESLFRNSCKRQLTAFTTMTQKLKDQKPDEAQQVRQNLIKETYHSDQLKLSKIQQQASKKTRDIVLIERKIDEIPSRAELQQYQRMFVELYEQVHSRLTETRQYYITYNTLNDTKSFLEKEISILKSIDDNYATAMTSNKVRFQESLSNILESVSQSLKKVEQKLKEEKEIRDNLNQKYLGLVEKERSYFKSAKDFQEECAKNEHLRSLEK